MKTRKPLFQAVLALLACLGLATSMAFAQAPARKAFGKGNPFTPEELPLGKLKNQLQAINPQARDKAMKWLHTFDFSESDAAAHLRMDPDGGIFIVCPDSHGNCEGHAHGPAKPEATNDSSGAPGTIAPEAAQTTEPPVENISVPAGSPPVYSSRPGSTRHIYLDFNGGIVTGTAWNNNASYGNVASWNVRAWSQDADRTTFNDAEQTWMRRIWQRLAEDYAPFDVNVTTDVTYDPDNYTGNKDNVGWLMVCETTDNNGVTLPTSGVGGVAYVGVFGNSTYSPTYQPAWVTSTNGGGNEAIVAEAASHEMGHNMGLSHDGTSSLGYYGGHAATASAPSWGPIMGTGYNQNVSQWSKGEYFSANQLQDDLTVMSGRIPYRTDDHGDNFAGATGVVATNNAISQSGLVETTSDPDVFSFTTGVGNISFTANSYRCDADTWGGNLDITLELYDSSQALITSSNPAAETNATISATVAAAGTYYLVLKPSAAGTPLVSPPSGYTVYGSLGQYTISGTVQPFDPPLGLTGISPSSGSADSSVTVDISGTKLSANTAVKLKKAGRADIAGTAVQMIGNTLRCQFNLTGVASGVWDVVATNPDLATSTLSAAFTVNGTLVSIWSENFDGTVTGWTSQAVLGTSNTWDIVTTASQSPNKSYFVDGPSTTSVTHLISPQIPIPADSANLQIEFWQRYSLQSGRDGGRLSFSVDGGAWFDVTSSNSGATFTLNGYTTAMATTGQTGPFAGVQAWSGTTSGNFVRTTINLSDIPKYAGKNLRLRWEIATNNSTASSGWYVDSVALLGDATPPNQPPVITVAASTSSVETQTDGPTTYQIIRGAGTALSVTATDDAGESGLTYTWQSTGPAPVVFSINGNNAAKNSTATFSTIGDYVLTVTASDTGNLSTPSSVNVRVLPTDSLVISPGSGNLTVGNTLQFSAAARDQFGTLLASQPSPINWSTSGGGTIDSSGLFTATAAGGPFTITATSGVSYSATAQVTVNPASATVQLGNLNQTYNGFARSVSVTTTPSGLAHSVTYAGSATAPTNVGTYAVVATITDPNYTGSASGSLVITKASQTINFGALADTLDNAAPFALSATATSGLSVSYASSNTSVATVSGGTVTVVGLGTTTITASQAGNSNYNAAGNVQQPLTVVRTNPLAVSGGPYKVLVGQSLSLNGSASQPSYGNSISLYEWDLNNDNTFGDATGATPSAISFANLTSTWGMLQGLNTIKLKVTDSASKTSIVSTTVELVLSLTWDANGASANRTDGGGAWIGISTLWWDGASNVNWASGSNALFGNNGAGGAVTLTGPTAVNSIIFNTFTGTYTLGTAGQAITLNGGVTNNSAAGAVLFVSPIILGGSQTWQNNSTAFLTLGNQSTNVSINNSGFTVTADGNGITRIYGSLSGTGGIIKNGSGKLVLGGQSSPAGLDHTYSGTTTIQSGILQIHSLDIGTGNIQITGGALSQYFGGAFTRALGSGSNEIRITGGVSGFSLQGSGGSFAITGTGSNPLLWGSAHFAPTEFILQESDATNTGAIGSFSNNIDLNGASRTIRSNQPFANFTTSYGNFIGNFTTSTGTAGLVKEGVGMHILTGTNTYNGGTTINDGGMRFGKIAAMPNSGAVTVNSGAVLGINLGAAGEWTAGTSGVGTLGGLLAGNGGAGTSTVSYSGNVGLELNVTTGTISHTNNISDLGTSLKLYKTGANTLALSGNNSYSGGTDLRAGILSVGSNTALGSGPLTINGGTLQTSDSTARSLANAINDLNGNITISGTGEMTLSNPGTSALAATRTFTINNPASTFAQAFSGAGFGITKAGTGSMILAGTNTYTGATAVSAGKLFVNGSTANSTITVGSGATLGGTGTLGGNATIAAGGKLEFNLSTIAASHNPLDIAAGRTLTFSGASELTITSSGGALPGQYTLINAINNIAGAAPATLNLPANWAATISIVGGNQLVLNVTSTSGDTTQPTLVSISDNKNGAPIPVNTFVTYTVTFSEDMDASTVTAAVFGNAGTASGTIDSVTETQPGIFTVQATPTSGGTLQLRINQSAVLKDPAGNNLDTNTALLDDTTLTIDGNPPTLTSITDDKNGAPIIVNTLVTYTVTFIEDMDAASVSAADFGNAGSAAGTIDSVVETLPGIFTVQATPSSAGTLQLRINQSAVLKDLAGNNLDTTTAILDDTNLTVDGTAPTLTSITDDKSGGPITVNTLVTYTVTFSVDMNSSTVTTTDFGNAGTAAATIDSVTETLPGIFTVQATPTSAGTLQIQIHAATILKDIAGNNLNTTSALLDDTTLTVDGTAPSLTNINDNKSGAPIPASTPVTYTVSFTEDMDAGTVTTAVFGNAGTAAVTIDSVTETLPGIFTVQATPISAGTLQLQINAATILKDLAGNNLNTTSALLDDTTLTVDGTAPTLTSITDDKSGAPINMNTLVTYTVTFSEDMDASTVDATDFGNAGTAPITIGTVTETLPGVFAVQATPTNAGTLQLQIPINSGLKDAAGNSLDTTSAIADETIISIIMVDGTAPTLTSIADDKGGTPIPVNTLVTYTVTFSEDMDASTVDATDFGNAGTAPVTIGAASETLPGIFTVQVTPTNIGTLQLQIPISATLKDVAGNNLVTTSALADDAIITVNTAFDSWSNSTFANGTLSDPNATLDFDGGGLATGIEWVVGGDPTTTSDDAAKAPTCDLTTDPAYITYTYRRSDAANADTKTAISVEYGNDLGGWTSAVAGPDIIITESDDFYGTGIDQVEVKIKRSSVGNRLFTRLKVAVAP